jgi:lysophospholipase L1-like esterase
MPILITIQFLLTLLVQQPMENKRTFLALGDSYTIGEAVDESQRWPSQFVQQMNAAGKLFGTPEIIAKTGWTTDELQAAIAEKSPKGPYDLVSLLIGVNNQYRGNSSEVYKKEFIELLDQALAFAGNNPKHVVVVSIPDWGATPFAEGRDLNKIASEIDHFNSISREVATANGVTYVDITAHSRTAAEDPELVTTDKLHPSGKMYTYWSNRVFDAMKDQYQ